MAGRRILVPFGEGDTLVPLTTATRTVVQVLAGTNIPFKIKSFAIFGDSIDLDAIPIPAELLVQTTAGTGGDACVEVLMDRGITHTIQVSGLQAIDGGEPTAGDELFPFQFAPSAGFIYTFPPGDELIVDTAERVGLRVLTPGATGVNVNGWIMGEE